MATYTSEQRFAAAMILAGVECGILEPRLDAEMERLARIAGPAKGEPRRQAASMSLWASTRCATHGGALVEGYPYCTKAGNDWGSECRNPETFSGEV